MARKNREKFGSVDRLPREVREKIGAMREDGKTLNEIMEELAGIPEAERISRSALHRWLRRRSAGRADVIEANSMADAIVRTFGDGKTDRVFQANVELLHAMMMKRIVQIKENEDGDSADDISSKELMMLAVAIEKLARASKTGSDQRQKEALELERRQTKEKAAETAVHAAQSRGISAETRDYIKAEILGMK